VLFKACKIRGQKGRGLDHVTYFSVLGFLNNSGILKATNCPKVVNGDDGNIRAELPLWSRAELIVGGGWGRGVWGALPPETKHLHTCQSIFHFACNLVHERFEDAKNPSSSPLPALCQLWKSGIELAVIVLRALIMIAATGETVHTSLKYVHVDYTVCILNFISVKNSKYQL